MESLSKQELISTITTQSDQIKRYENRLRDVVAAYKGLAKEKEALELSLNAINKSNNETEEGNSLAALTLSLSTLTAEKSRMEEAFQNDKKLTREKYEKIIASLKEESNSMIVQHQAEINNLKAKVGYEIQEREKERLDHGVMLKELHVKLNTERKTKEKLEDKCAVSTETQVSNNEMEKRVRDLSGELLAAQRKLQRAESRAVETPLLLVRLHEKMALLQQTHSVAIREEQIKAKRAEESARKVCAKQEERVSLLEERLAELSRTIGEYDLQRRQDRFTIQQLKDNLNSQILDKTTHQAELDDSHGDTDNDKLADSEYLQNLIDKIHILKKELIIENEKLGNPIEISAVFSIENYEKVHSKCKFNYDKLKQDFDNYKAKHSQEDDGNADNDLVEAHSEISKLKMENSGLKETVEAFRLLLEEEKQDKIDSLKLLEEKLKHEESFHKDIANELKIRVQSLEKQLHAQRDRYSVLLEETDNIIKSRNDRSRKVSSEEGLFRDNGGLTDATAPPHMLHYAHELARKDLDITQLRKDKHILEGQLRDSQREATIEKERFKEVVRTLKDEIDRLRRSQSREGANLEYLKNVVLAYLMSTDYAGRKHMINAISAVLHFTDTERTLAFSMIK